jgi:CheY-like chemotaxis protein
MQRPVPVTPKRILVVDDHLEAAATLAQLLEGLGHQPKIAFSGQDALVLARMLRPDVVLVDVVLPDMDGLELVRILKQEMGNSLQCLSVSGMGGDDVRARSLAVGCDRHLVKPVDINFLTSLLRSRAQ